MNQDIEIKEEININKIEAEDNSSQSVHSSANSKRLSNKSKQEEKLNIGDNIVENNTDSSKSINNNNNFLTPLSNLNSSSGSISKEIGYLTPKSIHNLNLIFSKSDEKSKNNLLHNKGMINNRKYNSIL